MYVFVVLFYRVMFTLLLMAYNVCRDVFKNKVMTHNTEHLRGSIDFSRR